MSEDPEDIFTKPITRSEDQDSSTEAERADEAPDDEPYFDIDTDVRPSTDTAIFNRRPEYARDEYGEYGSSLDPEEDSQVPPFEDEESRRLREEVECKYQEAEAEIAQEETRDE